jgi:hypothetical protein
MLRNINRRKKMNDVLLYIICGIMFGIAYGGTMWLLKWGMNKDLIITFKPFSIKIEEK